MSETLLKLDDVCGELFGIKPIIARRKAAIGALPVPAFRLNEARKGPFFIRRSDIDALVEKRAKKSSDLIEKMSFSVSKE